ncbi:MAG TPA: hypothetical protein VLH39_08100 [Magnetospirillaceae bacterium]|nr:hypothetical protein [Magnetospirillaceae bacterium]
MQPIQSAYSMSLAAMLSRNDAPGRVSIPVPRAQVIYSYFEHVEGVAAADGRASTVDKLKILDTLIDRMTAHRVDMPAGQENGMTAQLDRVDALLEQYAKAVHAIAVRGGPYAPILGLPPGSLISLAA